jgi:hypothetical protein
MGVMAPAAGVLSTNLKVMIGAGVNNFRGKLKG